MFFADYPSLGSGTFSSLPKCNLFMCFVGCVESTLLSRRQRGKRNFCENHPRIGDVWIWRKGIHHRKQSALEKFSTLPSQVEQIHHILGDCAGLFLEENLLRALHHILFFVVVTARSKDFPPPLG